MNIIKIFHFYSVWSIFIHAMFFLDIIGNTFPIALFVLIVSQLFLFIYPGYIRYKYDISWLNEFVLHWLPILLIEPNFENMSYLYITLLAYFLTFNKKILNIYYDPIQYLSN